MKASLLLLAASSVVLAENLQPRQFPGVGVGALGPVTAAMGIGGKVPKGVLARTVQLKATGSKALGSRRVKVRYGPYSVPGRDRGAIGKLMDGEGGMAWNMPDRNVQKPCTDCMMTYVVAGLESLKGTSLNTIDGMWLHHMVTINQGKGLKDATCASAPMSLPHLDVGSTGRNSERFFASGNERTISDMTAPGANIGYYIARGDKFHHIIELMNMNKAAKTVYMTITFEYVPGVPSGFSNIKPVWLDAFQCGLSDVEPKNQDGAFDIKARTWHSNFNGRLMGMGAHLHDGGIYADVLRNGKLLCRAKAEYNNRGPDMNGSSMKGMKKNMFSRFTANTERKDAVMHISKISYCGGPGDAPLGNTKVGDRWDISGHYDYRERPGMLRTNGKQSDVMAIAVIYAAIPMNNNRK